MGYLNNDAVLGKIGPDEPIFVLRAQDKTAPDAVRFWAKNAISSGANIEPAKLAEAEQCAQAMEQWPTRKLPD